MLVTHGTYCPTCGTMYPEEARFCTRDGTKLERVSIPPAPSAVPNDAPESSSRSPSHARVFETVHPEEARSSRTSRRSRASAAAAVPATEVREPAAELAQLVGQTLDGRYRIEEKVGEGGMSFVYRATDAKTGDRLAIKMLSPALSRDANAMARLRREAELAGKLEHPNVCHIIRLGEATGGMVYVVMPFMDGELLCDRAIREGQLALGVVSQFVSEIAAGLHVAHELGIVHRDLKPENVMLCPKPDGTTRAVVMDFGLAKERRVGAEVRKLTATGIVLGTPEFMSPEQLRGKSLDPRSDIYSLGLMTYELLTGQLPFSGKTQQDMMIARLKGDPTPIRAMRPDLGFSAAVEKVLLKSLSRDPDDRYATAPLFASAFAGAVRDR
ncbi:MAG TPA: serine/threonine-protein kinase [Gemmatimonadaceae bacterium]|nr:serine/threonine-protein kinase [Gemmatimonadaceae bacterium]